MSEEKGARRIGLFVVGAIFLVLVAIVMLGSRAMFRPTDRYVAFFDGSVRGLQVGAPVTFRGVQIGEVVEIYPIFAGPEAGADTEALQIRIEVVFDIEIGAIQDPERATEAFRGWDSERVARWAADRGFRATLATQSLLTGLKYVDIDRHPGTPATLVGVQARYPEFPTRKGGLERFQERVEAALDELADLPIEEIGDETVATLRAVRALAESPDIPHTLGELDDTLARYRALADDLETEVADLVGRLEGAADATRNAADQAGSAMSSFEQSIDEDSSLRYELHRTLASMRDTADALRALVDYLDRHPEAVLSGRPSEEE
jgi:paraquat-inducible protein B